MIVAGTGHRPEDCTHGEDAIRARIRETLSGEDVNIVISGMAAGFDLWLADEAISLGIPVWAARPWSTHEARVSDAALYAHVVENAERVVIVTESDTYPGPWVYHKRNEWMVDHATHVLAYWSGKEKGGTYACVQYAVKQEVPVRNIYG